MNFWVAQLLVTLWLLHTALTWDTHQMMHNFGCSGPNTFRML